MKFLGSDLTASSEKLNNPRRGFLRMCTFELQKEPDFRKAELCQKEGLRLFHVFIDIGAYRDCEIPEEAAERLSEILAYFSSFSDFVLRIAYDRVGKGLEKEPDFPDMVISHMKSLGPVVSLYSDHILSYQGLFVGSWGEMHSSKFVSYDSLKTLYKVFRENFGDTKLSFRTPRQIRNLFSEKKLSTTVIGLFDDAIFGSENHLGTYGSETRNADNWKNSWCPTDEMEFVAEMARRVPFGGEVLFSEKMDYHYCLRHLEKLHVTYLNSEHDAGRIDEWKNTIVSDGLYAGKSVFSCIEARLGYRYQVTGVGYFEQGLFRKKYFLEISMKNMGFASIDVPLFLYLQMADGEELFIDDLSYLNGNDEKTYTVEIPKGRGTVRVLARLEDGRSVTFSNIGADETGLTIGELR